MLEVWRVLRTPRWIALTALALVVVVGFGLLSRWQWERAHRDDLAAAEAADPRPVPLGTVLGTEPLAVGSYGRRVELRGAYRPGEQRLVPRGDGYWVVTPLVTEGQDPGGPLVVPVVRGVVDDPQAPPPPAGPAEVVGRVEPYEGDPGPQPGDARLPAGQLPRLTAATLAAVVDPGAGGLAGGWVALSAQEPPSGLPAAPAPSAPEAGAALRWQNASYAVQWVLFAGFVAFFWWRWFRDDLRAERVGAEGAAAAS